VAGIARLSLTDGRSCFRFRRRELNHQERQHNRGHSSDGTSHCESNGFRMLMHDCAPISANILSRASDAALPNWQTIPNHISNTDTYTLV
jgi:hypothetical protein